MLVQLFNLALALLDWSQSFKGMFPMVSGGVGRDGKLPVLTSFSLSQPEQHFFTDRFRNSVCVVSLGYIYTAVKSDLIFFFFVAHM